MSESPMFFKQMAIRKMAVDMAIPEKVIEQVITHSFKRAREAFHENSSIEISGFGKFLVSQDRLKAQKYKYVSELKKWKKQLEDPEVTPVVVKNRLLFVERIETELMMIKKLTHED